MAPEIRMPQDKRGNSDTGAIPTRLLPMIQHTSMIGISPASGCLTGARGFVPMKFYPTKSLFAPSIEEESRCRSSSSPIAMMPPYTITPITRTTSLQTSPLTPVQGDSSAVLIPALATRATSDNTVASRRIPHRDRHNGSNKDTDRNVSRDSAGHPHSVAVFGATGVVGTVIARSLGRKRCQSYRAVCTQSAELEKEFGDDHLAQRVSMDPMDQGSLREAVRGLDVLVYAMECSIPPPRPQDRHRLLGGRDDRGKDQSGMTEEAVAAGNLAEFGGEDALSPLGRLQRTVDAAVMEGVKKFLFVSTCYPCCSTTRTDPTHEVPVSPQYLHQQDGSSRRLSTPSPYTSPSTPPTEDEAYPENEHSGSLEIVDVDYESSSESFNKQPESEEERLLMEAHRQRKISVAILRLPELYGPECTDGLIPTLIDFVLQETPRRRRLSSPPSPDPCLLFNISMSAPVNLAYLSDIGPVVAELLKKEEAYGKVWELCGPGAITPAAIFAHIYHHLGRPIGNPSESTTAELQGWGDWASKKMETISFLLSPASLVAKGSHDTSPDQRQCPSHGRQPHKKTGKRVVEHNKEWARLMDDSALLQLLPSIRKTSYSDGIQKTMIRAGAPCVVQVPVCETAQIV